MTVFVSQETAASIDPAKTYTLSRFIAASGLTYQRIRAAAKAGVEIPTYSIGRRKFIDGGPAIRYLHALAAMHVKQQAAKQAAKNS